MWPKILLLGSVHSLRLSNGFTVTSTADCSVIVRDQNTILLQTTSDFLRVGYEYFDPAELMQNGNLNQEFPEPSVIRSDSLECKEPEASPNGALIKGVMHLKNQHSL